LAPIAIVVALHRLPRRDVGEIVNLENELAANVAGLKIGFGRQ
jgi:hypothetical protein